MFPTTSPGSSPGAAPLPPLPNLSGGGGAAPGADSPQSAMAAIMSGVAPIKAAVDKIIEACREIVQSGALPGSEQKCGQIVAAASSLIPEAVQQMMQPGPGGAPGGPLGPVGGAPVPGGGVGPVGQ